MNRPESRAIVAVLFAILTVFGVFGAGSQTPSVARLWDEEILFAIRRDQARPPVHARNLFHLSAAMWDAWAAYDPNARQIISTEKATATDIETARAEAVSFAAYRVLSARYAAAINGATSLAAFNTQMDELGYNKSNTATVGNTPAALGNRIAVRVLQFGLADGANEQANYAPPGGYTSANDPLVVVLPGNPGIHDANRWQSMTLSYFVDQSGNPIPTGYPAFVGPHWDSVTPFGLSAADHGPPGGIMHLGIYLDPGPPPLLGTSTDAEYKNNFVSNIRYSSWLTPDDGVTLDTSPGGWGANPLGTNDGQGHRINPVTGRPYTPRIAKRGDFGRILAEYWADGPASETPPGHWNVLANSVTDSLIEKRIGGAGPVVNDLEWDVKLYLALNGAVHDAAVACWGAKGYYDWIRPISAIRYMADQGQSSDSGLPSYSPNGLPLIPGLIELITAETTAPGQRHEALAGNEGKVAVLSWPGPPANALTQYSGVKWILGSSWITYQLKTFITPPFAGYYSGHSTFSRSSAEVLTRFMGSEFFPGGMGEFVAEKNHFLKFELGPSETVHLQWGTYYDAADQAGISRIYGSIHPYVDDFTGRRQGHMIGIKAFEKALYYYNLTLTDDAVFLAHTIPAQIPAGHTIQATVTMQNTGTEVWNGATGFSLAVTSDTCAQAASDRVTLDEGETVAPGASHTFTFTLHAPTTGTCSLGFQMIKEGTGPFGELLSVQTEPGSFSNDCLFIGSSIPPVVTPGRISSVGIQMQNIGNTTWKASDGFALAVVSDPCQVLGGVTRIEMDSANLIAPNQAYQFISQLIAPASEGACVLQVQMTEGSIPFGPVTEIQVNVVAPANAVGDWVKYE